MKRILSALLAVALFLILLPSAALSGNNISVTVILQDSVESPVIEFAYGKIYHENGFASAERITSTQEQSQNGETVYRLLLPESGIVYYKASYSYYDEEIDSIFGAFSVNENSQTVKMAAVLFYPTYNNVPYTLPEGMQLQNIDSYLEDGDGNKFFGTYHVDDYAFANGNTIERQGIAFLVPAYGNNSLLTFHASVKNMTQSYFVFPITQITVFPSTNAVSFTVGDPLTKSFKITKDAELELGYKIRHYIPFEPIVPDSVDTTTDPDYDIYTFTYGNIAGATYRVKLAGYITEVKTVSSFASLDNETVVDLKPDLGTRVSYRESNYRKPNGYEDSILLNAPDSQCVSLKEGDEFTIRPLRAFQIIENEGSNFYFEPEYHYEIVSGDSIEIESITNNYNISNATVKGVKPGVSLVRISYDPIIVSERDVANFQNVYFNGIAPEQIGLIVFQVGSVENSSFYTGIDLREFDTVYINGGITYPDGTTTAGSETVSYSFTPESNTTVRLLPPPANPVACDDWGLDSERWIEYSPASDGSFTVQLREGRNIVELTNNGKTLYHVIKAKKVVLTISNDSEPGKLLRAGNRATLNFDGISMPLPKLAAIYNPGYSSNSDPTVGVRYLMNGDLVRSDGTQYYLTQMSQIHVTFDDAGVYSFTDGNIGCSWFGSALGAHRDISPLGLTPNFNAPDNELRPFSILPEFELTVAEEADDYDKLHACELESFFLGSADVTNQPVNTLPRFIETNVYNVASIVGIQYNGTVYGKGHMGATDGQSGIPDGLELTWRYWQENNNGERTSEIFVENITSFPVSCGELSIDNNDESQHYGWIHGELIVRDTEGLCIPHTYTVSSGAGNTPINFTRLTNIQINAVGSEAEYSSNEGVLIATPVGLKNEDHPLGYGFLFTECDYSYYVPNDTETITIKPITCFGDSRFYSTGESATVKVIVNGIETETITPEYEDAEHFVSTTPLPSSQQISLEEGENTIQLIVSAKYYTKTVNKKTGKITWRGPFSHSGPTTYTITVIRAAVPRTISFYIPDGATVLVEQNEKTKTANDDGTYTLKDGDYTYHVEKAGFITKSESFTVSENRSIAVESLEPVPAQSGNVTVRIAGQDAVIVPEEAVEINSDPEDLAKLRYVRYNHGGYTVLHALLDACDPAPFTCRKGVFIPEIDIDETDLGANAGWVCEVNGAVCADPANTLVYGGDKIDFYYNSDYADMQHARFKKEDIRITEGSSATLTLQGTPIGGGSKTPIADADIYLGKTYVGKTDGDGKITVPAGMLSEKRVYFVTAKKENAYGDNALTCAVAFITVEKDNDKEPSIPGRITVSFRLIGDTIHGNAADGHSYETWIGTTTYAFAEDSVTVGEVFSKALENAGLSCEGLNQGYISAITSPDGYELAEFNNGSYSGWMYTVNGNHPGLGLNNTYVTDGDEIVWHYVDGYILEVWDNYGGSSGNTSTWNTWMDTADGPSINAGAIVTVEGAKTKQIGNHFTATLPYGTPYPGESDVYVVTEDTRAVFFKGLTQDSEDSWSFGVRAQNGTERSYTLSIAIGEKTAQQILTEVKAAIEDEDWTTDQATANDADSLKDFVESKLAKMDLSNADWVATITDVTPAKEGTAENTTGKAGSYDFTVALSLLEASETAEVTDADIRPTEYVPPTQDVPYKTAMKGVLGYLAGNTKNPGFEDEWVVFALNRGGTAEDDWNNLYFANLQAKVNECDGILDTQKYTEYSRVVLALTSAGIDATQFATETETYDLVKPLLDKQSNGTYLAEQQGNNGTMFALLALDSHDYYDTAEGKAARAALIASLLDKQLTSGAWSISGTVADLDMTAAGVYALAPYYNDPDKLSALGGSITHDELTASVDKALKFLSGKQNAHGGFGSAEADVWALIALASVGRDADTDAMFVKAEGSLLDDLLRYYDESSGGFLREDNISHSMKVNAMSSEQAAYGLVAYDRFVENRNALYDMSDVDLMTLAQRADLKAAQAVEELIDDIGEVTLKSSAAITAARSAYNALTSEQKALVSNLKTLTDAEATYKDLVAQADQEEIDKNAAESVDSKIDAIGTVTLDSEKAITAARTAYNALTDAQKKLVEGLAVLEAAEAKLAEQKENAKTLATVTFRLKGGTSKEVKDGEEIIYTKGELGNELPTAERDGYTFDGWFDAPVGGTQHTKVTASLPEILYAQWTSNGGSSDTITVSFVLYGDTVHASNVGPHSLADSTLTEWIPLADYQVDKNATVLDVFELALTKAGLTWDNPGGNYITSVTNGDIKLAEFTNGNLSGWKYTLNGIYSSNGVSEQSLTDGDCILFHYTDDYTVEANMTGNAVQSMTMIPETLTVETGKTGELRVSIEPAQLNGSVPVVWTSSETAIASVDKNGVVTGLAEGEATITAKSEATGFSATATVTVVAGEEPVIAVESVTVTPAALTLKEGETGTLTATILPDDATAKDVQWSSDNEAVATVKDGVVTAVKAGTATITATAGGKSTAVTVTVEAEEPQDTDEVTYSAALKSVLKYLEEKVPNPKLAEISGEWAVFALNRGNAAAKDWNDTYLANLMKSLDDVNGVLAEGIKYSAYSRVILALTSMGVDASQITTDKATYDLVKPLLDKDEDGSYMVEAQGNNGTIFALLALDSHDYLPGSEGKALRAELIDSLKENQLDSGAWAISGKTAPDLDMTAAAVYVLAPYYNDPDKLAALGGTVTHAEVKAMVDGALAYLSEQQGADGGFGSAEADVWAIIALASVGRDADTDEMFVKADGSLLDDLLSYYDASSGGFLREDNISHAMKVNQMSSEQAAYGLVAYDRFKNGKTALYDMSDVEIKTLEEKANKAAAEEVEDLIDAIGEATLESKAKIDAARAAYDALTDAQKKLVSNLKTLTDAEAAYEKLAAEADQEEVDKAAAKGVDDLIEAIGEVTLDSEKAIKAARSAYDALTDAQKKLVENLAALEAAEKTLAALKENAEKIATVTFHLRNGTSDEIRDGEEITYTKGDLGKALPSAKRDGYSFQGWFDFPTDGAKFTKVTADLPEDLYAQWKSNSSGSGEDSETKISVTFRLIGAEKAEKKVDLGAEEYMPDYVTWIATTTYELDEGDTVYDLWVKALREHGLSSEGAENNYVKTVYAPASLGGYALSEFTNGPRSGWMYTINGRHPGYGLVEQELKDGDRVIWHYVNDYSYEVSDWFDDGKWAALGDGRYYNRWLKAPDRFGSAGGGLGEGAKSSSSGGSGDSETSLTPSFDGDTVWLPAEVDRHPGGAPYSATAVLTNEIVTEGLEKAEDKSRLTLWVEIEDSNGLVMKIDPKAVKTIADTGAGLRMECRVGVIELSAEDVAKLAESGNEVRFAVSYDDWNYKARMSVTVNHKAADVKMKIELPAPDGSQALAIVNSDSSLTVLKKSAVIVDRAYAEITGSASLTFVDGIRRWDDVKKDDWYYNAVAFMVAHELMTGVDRFEFAPKSPMTRAMLVTVLYRLEDLPEIVGSEASFGDVDSESWYADAVAWASENGIVNGTDRGFEPNANITREQIATILYRYAKYIGLVGPDAAASGDISKFGDGEKVSSWAQEAMAWAVEVGLFKGDDTGSLNPQGNATRAEVATLIERLIKLIVLS